VIRCAWAGERTADGEARAAGDTPVEWHHLERTHNLSHPLLAALVRTHLAMLGYGLRHRHSCEVVGQSPQPATGRGTPTTGASTGLSGGVGRGWA
jgi:hypothetical protein